MSGFEKTIKAEMLWEINYGLAVHCLTLCCGYRFEYVQDECRMTKHELKIETVHECMIGERSSK